MNLKPYVPFHGYHSGMFAAMSFYRDIPAGGSGNS